MSGEDNPDRGSNVIALRGDRPPAPPRKEKRARRPPQLRPPPNRLCQADHPVDVISPTRKIVYFLQMTNRMTPCDGEPGDNDYREGQDWILGLVGDALEYAQELAERRDREAT